MPRHFLYIFTALISTACVKLEAPICTPSNMEDILGLEGYFQVKTYNLDELEMETMTFSFERKGVGLYEVDQGAEMRTCRIGGFLYVQNLDPSGETFSPYRIEAVRSEHGFQGFHLMMLGASRSVLDQKEFPYLVLEEGNEESKVLSLILKNAAIDLRLTTQVLDVMGFSMHFIPVRNVVAEDSATRARKKKFLEKLRIQATRSSVP